MVPILALWAPIVLSAVLVLVVSSIIHTVLPYHRSDLKRLPAEDQTMEALRKFALPPGDYLMPHPGGPGGMKRPDFIEKAKQGPVAMLTVAPLDPMAMGSRLLQWFAYCLVVGVCAAYVAGRALGPGAPYLAVFRFVGFAAFLGYSLALAQNSIWYWKSWSATLKNMFDGLIYGLLTAGSFGWLWPRPFTPTP